VPRISNVGGAVAAGRVGQAVAVGEVAAVALVAHDDRAGTEQVAVADAGAVEDPVVGPVHRVAAGAVRDPLADAVVTAAAKLTPVICVLGPPIRWSDHMLVSSPIRSVPNTGRRLNCPL
jgi:hypothetical protein